MSRNVESRFAINPTNIDISRSTFDRSHSHKTTFNVGEIVPVYLDEVLPGDTFVMDSSKLLRLQSLITPPMDNLYLDTYFFFVPNRLLWKHWKEFNGENNSSPWLQPVSYSIPTVTSPDGGWSDGTLADHFGIPTGVSSLSVNALPFRAYSLIINDWFRDENVSNPLNFNDDDTSIAGSNGSNFVTDVIKGGMPYIASKYHDYFTSCLPSPQKGPDVPLPLGESANVYTKYIDNNYNRYPKNPNTGYPVDLRFRKYDGSLPTGKYDLMISSGTTAVGGDSTVPVGAGLYPSNLYADLTTATGTSINQLRLAFQIQKFYEKDARGGTRYIELIKSHFGVTSPDARMQRPEYLGGNRLPITINQVVQTSASDQTPQGNTAAYSLTVDHHSDFTKSFTEHGFVIGLCVARYEHTYQQGLERLWSRRLREDFYWPVFANIGEQAVKNGEIYAQGSSVVNPSSGKSYDDEVFGYQEAWADYRYKPNRVTGEMRSNASNHLDYWHFADNYASLPHLSEEWIREDKSNVDRSLAVQSSISNQILGDFYFKCRCTRPMPVYSIPGLIDHH